LWTIFSLKREDNQVMFFSFVGLGVPKQETNFSMLETKAELILGPGQGGHPMIVLLFANRFTPLKYKA
jgi:hypothetical protein